MTDLRKHPVLREIYEVQQAVEKLGCSPEHTGVTTQISHLMQTAETLVEVASRLANMVKIDAPLERIVPLGDKGSLTEIPPGMNPEDFKGVVASS